MGYIKGQEYCLQKGIPDSNKFEWFSKKNIAPNYKFCSFSTKKWQQTSIIFYIQTIKFMKND